MAEQQKPGEQEIEQVRKKTTALAERAKNDPSFRARVKNDPAAVLRAEGLPEMAIAELLHRSRNEDVTGHDSDGWLYECVFFTTSYDWIYEGDIFD